MGKYKWKYYRHEVVKLRNNGLHEVVKPRNKGLYEVESNIKLQHKSPHEVELNVKPKYKGPTWEMELNIKPQKKNPHEVELNVKPHYKGPHHRTSDRVISTEIYPCLYGHSIFQNAPDSTHSRTTLWNPIAKSEVFKFRHKFNSSEGGHAG